MSHNKHASDSPFHQKHLYLGSPMIHNLNAKQKPIHNVHMSQPYVPSINISLKNQLSINLMGSSSKYGSQSYRDTLSNRTYEISKKIGSINKKQPTQYSQNNINSQEKYNSQKSTQTVRQQDVRENNFLNGEQSGSQAEFLQKQLDKHLQQHKQKPKSMDQYSSVVKGQPTSKQQSVSKLKIPTEPSDNISSHREIGSNAKKNEYLSTQTIMSLIQKINSQKQSICKSPTQQDILTQNFKKLISEYNKVLVKPVQQKPLKTKLSDQKLSTLEDVDLTGFKPEIQNNDTSSVTILLFDLDKTVTEFKFDSSCGTTDQLINFLMNQTLQKKDYQKIIGFHTVDKNIAIDYYLSLSNRSLEPLNQTTIRLQPLLRIEEQQSQLSLKSFHFLQCVGMGGFSRVYLVRSKGTGRFLALKLISKQFIVQNQKQSIVQNERDVMVQLSQSSCKFICKVECAFETKSWVCFGMEYCSGGELFNQLRKVKRMTEDQARIYFIQVGTAVSYLHENNVLYRDIKPENILIDENGHLKLADFGLARPNMTADDEAYSFCGSPEYMAPEMLQQQGHNYSVDYYCLGALLYELLTGLPPYYSRDTNKIFQSILYENLQFPQGVVSNSARDLIKGLLTKNPDERLGSQGGVKFILQHQWVQQINIDSVLTQSVKPPFPANLISFNFDSNEFKKGEASFKQELQRSLSNSDELVFKMMFKDFYYISQQLKINKIYTQNNSTDKTNQNSTQSEQKNDIGRRVNSAGSHQEQNTRTLSSSLKHPLQNYQSVVQPSSFPKKQKMSYDRDIQISRLTTQSKQTNIQKRLQMQTNMKNQQQGLFLKSLVTEQNDYSLERVSFNKNYNNSIQDDAPQNSQRQIGRITQLKKK